MTENGLDFSVVIPLYNEEGCAQQSIQEILNALRAEFENRFELILVVNGSVDRTPEICENFSKRVSAVKIVRLQKNAGYGGGILNGLRQAKGTYLGFTCGDGQAPPAILVKLMKAISAPNNAYDLVKAVRINRKDGFARHLQSIVYNHLFRTLFQIPFDDINAMPKLMRKDIYQKLYLESTDWFIDAEIMIKAHYAGLRVQEIQAEYLSRSSGTSFVRISTVYEFIRNATQLFRSGKLADWKCIRTHVKTLLSPLPK